MAFHDLIGRARAATVTVGAGGDPTVHGLASLAGGMTHAVFAPVDDEGVVVKVFDATARGASSAKREWDALGALRGSGVAAEPLHFEAGAVPIVVMTRVGGAARPAVALDVGHAGVLGNAHRLVHDHVPLSGGPEARSAIPAAWPALLQDEPRDHRSPAVADAWREASAWITGSDLTRLVSGDDARFSRGDPNLTNYLWDDDGGVVLVDWEDSGAKDPALEVADMAEHASTRALGDDFWDALAEATHLSPAARARVAPARRLMACVWLALIASRERQGLPTTLSLEEQAIRTLATLHA